MSITNTAMSRRSLLQVGAVGALTTATLSACSPGGASPAPSGSAADVSTAYKNFTWISPRGTLDVVDDYPYWVAKELGYLGNLPTDMQAGPSDATAVVKFTALGQADIGYPSPGVLTYSIDSKLDLVSVFGLGRLDLFNIAFRKGEGMKDLKGLEGKTVLLGSPGWQSICDPMFAAVGVDVSKITYVDAGFPGWTSALASGKGDAALVWEGVRAQLEKTGLPLEYWLGRLPSGSPLPSNSMVVRKADLADPAKKEFIQQYLTAFAKGLEFADRNPRAAAQIVLKYRPSLQGALGEEAATRGLIQMHSVYKGDFASRPIGWGDHDLPQWDLFFSTAKKVGLTKADIKASDWVLNDFIATANAFDKDKVHADADGFALSAAMSAVDLKKVVGTDLNDVTNA